MRRISKNSKQRVWAVLAAAAVAALGAQSAVAGEITSTWSGNSGNWTDPTQWSTNPNYPNNGTPSGTTYDAVIDAPGAGAYTVTLNSSIATDSVTINSPNATLAQTGGTLFAGTVNISAGTYQDNGALFQGTIYNSATFQVTNGGTAYVRLGDDTNGMIEVDSASAVNIQGTVNTSQLGNLVNNGGTFTFLADLTNTGETFTVGGPTGAWALGSSTAGGPAAETVIQGGVVSVLPGTMLNKAGFEDLTLASALTVNQNGAFAFLETVNCGGQSINVSGSGAILSVGTTSGGGPTIAAGTLSNAVVNLGGPTANADGCYLFSNSGSINSATGGPSASGQLVLDPATTVQGWGTIGADAQGNHSSYLTNSGTISANVAGQALIIFPQQSGEPAFTNLGTLQAINGGILNISTPDEWENFGTVQALSGGAVAIAGGLDFSSNHGVFAVDSNNLSSITISGSMFLPAFDVTLGSNGTSGILAVTGNLSLPGNSSLNLAMAPDAVFSTPYEIISYTGTLTGAFENVTPGYVVDYSQPGEILVTAIPEPGSGLLVTGAALLFARRRRRNRSGKF